MEDFSWPLHLRFFIALGLSFLVGLERECSGMWNKGRVFAGVRTYSLIGIYGFGCAWLFTVNVTWALPVGMLTLSGLVLVGYLAKLKVGHVGWTSEVAALLTFVIGALCLMGDMWVPMALGIVSTFLLSEKAKIETYVEKFDKTEFLAVIKFLLVALIILPVLPNREYFEFNLNPSKIWRIVILVSSVGFVGYFLVKKFGGRVGLWLSGLLGGIVSSTAVSIASGRIARQTPNRRVHALQASILASSIMYLRILALIWFIQPQFLPYIWWKLVILSVVGFILSFVRNGSVPGSGKESVKTLKNPFELKPALIFALLFVILSVGTVLVDKIYGEVGLIVLAFVTGITDIDPFILSLVGQGSLTHTVIISAILVSMMSNTLVKGFYFAFTAKAMYRETFWRFGLWALLHIPLIYLN